MTLTIQYHAGNPGLCRIPELKIGVMPECEGGGWYMPREQAEMIVGAVRFKAEIELGFAAFSDGTFELIARNIESGEETTLEGKLKPGQTLKSIDHILPSCVFIRATAKA